MINQTIDIEFLAARIEKIEEEQNIRNKNILWLKRYFEELKQEFDARPEVKYLENLQSAIAALSDQVRDLQESLEQRLNVNGRWDDTASHQSELAEHYADMPEKANVAEDEQIDTTHYQQSIITFSNEKFKLLRMMQILGTYGDMLLLEAYLVEEKSQVSSVIAEEVPQGSEVPIAVYLVEEKSPNTPIKAEEVPQGSEIPIGESREYRIPDRQSILRTVQSWIGTSLTRESVAADLTEEKSQDTPVSAEELLKQYNEGERDFTGLNLADADLVGAVLCGMIDLSGVNLSGANLKGANLRNAKLIGANLSHADLSQVTLIGANLKGANIQETNFRHGFYDETTVFPTGFDATEAGVYLIAPGASLQNAFLAGSDLNHVSLSGANLQGANLNSTNLEGANLIAANLSGASLIGANLKSARLVLANLKAANLTRANLSGARLSQVNLSEANISSVDLSKTFLWRANLQKANLEGANLVGSNLREAKLSGAILPDGTVHR